jgi:hypothetical protein
MSKRLSLLLVLIAAVSQPMLRAWDYAGHRIVNETALAALPEDFPAFVRDAEAAERVAFLAGEPDRWRNVPDLPIKQANGLDHYLDIEHLIDAGMDVAKLPSFRYDFAVAYAAGRAANAGKFPAIDPAKNKDHVQEWAGFAPWAITEGYGKLKSAFAYLKVFQEIGTPEEVAQAEANALYVMGVLGHYVGDLAQPLHTTKHYNGWTGDNPEGYTTWNGFHAWIDGGFFAQVGVDQEVVTANLAAAKPISIAPREDGRDPVFVAVMDYVIAQNAKVEPLYQLDHAGKLKADGTSDPAEARRFLSGQLRAGGEMLAAIWVTAWRNAPPDLYLRNNLLKRQAAMAK